MSESKTCLLPEMAAIWQETLNWQPTQAQQQQFQRLYEWVLMGNQKLNLTRITHPEDFWEKHLWDSLCGFITLSDLTASNLTASMEVIDIGTGAGFPGVPTAIVLENSTVTLLDATQKKIAFLETLLQELALKNAKILMGRAEEINRMPQYHQSYDIALLRAVASAAICAKYALPFLKPNGLAILYRGHWTSEAESDLKSTLDQCGGILESVAAFKTPLTQSMRHCVYLRKKRTL